MKKLAGTSWGADATTLKRLYTGRARPTLEYGITAWGTAAKSNFNKVSKIQNQVTRIITGAMKSTPIMELETATGLEPLEDRRDTKILVQAAKFKRLPTHPMKERLGEPIKGRLKRESFVHQVCTLERRDKDILVHEPREIPQYLTSPTWSTDQHPLVESSILGVHNKGDQSNIERKYHTLEHINSEHPLPSRQMDKSIYRWLC